MCGRYAAGSHDTPNLREPHLIHRHRISNPQDAQTWQKMAGIKSSILRRMDTAPSGVRICCVKFVQKVVQVQTPGLIADPRVRSCISIGDVQELTELQRPDQNEISLALVPRDHPIIPPSNLEAEASGLLDRLLSALQDSRSVMMSISACQSWPSDCTCVVRPGS